MGVALTGLWRSQRARIDRPGKLLFGLAVAATVLIAGLTCIVVVGTALGFRPSMPDAEQSVPAPLVALASILFLFTLLGILGGYIGSGVTTICAGVWPRLAGWALIARPSCWPRFLRAGQTYLRLDAGGRWWSWVPRPER